MAPVIPTTTGQAVLIDCGANAECTPEYLVQFAYLGGYYAHRMLGVERPRVGLLNIGTEDSKGTDLQKETLRWLREAHTAGHLNFIGNIEAKEAIKGGCDVIVCDGFSGNVLLKTMEGVGSFAGSALKAMFKKNLLTKLAALCVMPGSTPSRPSWTPIRWAVPPSSVSPGRSSRPTAPPTPRPSKTPWGRRCRRPAAALSGISRKMWP